MAVWRDVDKVGTSVNADRSNDLILLGVNYAEVAGARVDYVDFISLRIGGNAGRLRPHLQSPYRLKRAHVNDSDGIALAVRDVGVLTVERPERGQAALVEVPPSAGQDQRNENCDGEDFSQRTIWSKA